MSIELALISLRRELEKTNIIMEELLDELKKMNEEGESSNPSLIAKAMAGIIEKQNEIKGDGDR